MRALRVRRVGGRVKQCPQREEGVDRCHPRHQSDPAEEVVNAVGHGEVTHDRDVEGEDGAFADQTADRERDRHGAHQQGGARRDRVTGEDRPSRHAPEVLREREQRQARDQQREDEEQAAEEVAQHDLRGGHRRGEQDVPCPRVGLLGDGPGHEHGREHADERDLQIGHDRERARCRRGELELRELAPGRHDQQQVEQGDDERAEVDGADVEVPRPARAALNQRTAMGLMGPRRSSQRRAIGMAGDGTAGARQPTAPDGYSVLV